MIYKISVLTICLYLTACGSLFNTRKQLTYIKSNATGANIKINGEQTKFSTPALVELEVDKYYTLTLQKEGYKTNITDLGKEFRFAANSKDKVWCILSALTIVGGIVDLATEACWVGYRDSYYIQMSESSN